MVRKRHILAIAMAALLLCAAASLMTGCRISDVLKEIIYDQSADQIDYENENKFIINDERSEVINPDLSTKEISDEAPADLPEQNLVVYGSEPNTTGFTAKESVFSLHPSFQGLEASKGVTYYKSDSKDALENESEDIDEDDKDNDEDEDTSEVDVATEEGEDLIDGGMLGSGDSPLEGDVPGEDGIIEPIEDENGVSGSGDGDEGDGSPDEDGDDYTKAKPRIINSNGKLVKLPAVDSIAAYGAAAVMVQSLGGRNALAATDKDLLDSDFTKVFSDDGASKIETGWSDDGSASNMKVDNIIDSGAEVILCYSTDYANSLTNKKIKKLNDADISFVLINSFASSEGILANVDVIRDLLKDSKKIGQQGNVAANAKAYKEFHDGIIDAVMAENSDKLAGDEIYESRDSKPKNVSYNSDAKYTLLIDVWDDKASYTHSLGGGTRVTSDDAGIGGSIVSYTTRPTSYYIQCAGLINRPAVFGKAFSGRTVVVSQFESGARSIAQQYYDIPANSDLANAYWQGSGSSWSTVFLTVPDSVISDTSGTGSGYGFGTTRFPKIIVPSSSAKSKIIKNSKTSTGYYTPYDFMYNEGGFSAFFGIQGSSGTLYSTIGALSSSSGGVATTNVFKNGIEDESICVNPSGMFMSWTSEGSMESVLEAAFVNDEVNDDASKIGYKSYIRDFYSSFYRYSLSTSELNKIVGE